jgi:hypothetical protein
MKLSCVTSDSTIDRVLSIGRIEEMPAKMAKVAQATIGRCVDLRRVGSRRPLNIPA